MSWFKKKPKNVMPPKPVPPPPAKPPTEDTSRAVRMSVEFTDWCLMKDPLYYTPEVGGGLMATYHQVKLRWSADKPDQFEISSMGVRTEDAETGYWRAGYNGRDTQCGTQYMLLPHKLAAMMAMLEYTQEERDLVADNMSVFRDGVAAIKARLAK